MKEKIKLALRKLQEERDPGTAVQFEYVNKAGNKGFIARLSYSDAGEPGVSLVSCTGYTENYLASRLKDHINNLRNLSLERPKSGDIILTRLSTTNPPPTGIEILLDSATYYYSVNDGLLSCQGDQLGTAFQAMFIKTLTARCHANAEVAKYSQFKLL
jgi:hypothetical protein